MIVYCKNVKYIMSLLNIFKLIFIVSNRSNQFETRAKRLIIYILI